MKGDNSHENRKDYKKRGSMVEIQDNCVGCMDTDLPCIGDACPHSPVYTVTYCDRCGATVSEEALCGGGFDDLCEDCYDELYGVGAYGDYD